MRVFTLVMFFCFTTFLVVPTVVSIINHDADISVFFDLEEDSNEKEVASKEVKMAQEIHNYNLVVYYNIPNGNKIIIYHDAIISNNYTPIFSPPPELI